MKRHIALLICLICILTFTGCGIIPTDWHSVSILSAPPIDNTQKINYDIKINSPMTLSNNDLFPINRCNQYMRLKMVKGRYYEDWSPGAYMGTIWEGYFSIELADESGNLISLTDLNEIYNEPLIFNSSFQIQFDDYNNDGDADFTIGQYVSGNGRNYKLFTIRKDGNIEELHIKDYSSLFISDTTGFYSTKLTKTDNLTFKINYYDNSKGETLEDIFKWNGKEFIKN